MNDLGIIIFDLKIYSLHFYIIAVYGAHSTVVLSVGESIYCISNFVDTLAPPTKLHVVR